MFFIRYVRQDLFNTMFIHKKLVAFANVTNLSRRVRYDLQVSIKARFKLLTENLFFPRPEIGYGEVLARRLRAYVVYQHPKGSRVTTTSVFHRVLERTTFMLRY